MTETKRIMIFDDDEEFSAILVDTLTKYGYYAEHIPSMTKLNATNWNNFWDCIITDVDFDGEPAPGHEIISHRIKENHLDCPVIVITGKREYDLEKIEEQHGATFAAYLSKNNPDFLARLIRAIDQALHEAPKLALARQKFLFKKQNKLDYVIAREELSDEILGITPREADTTIGILIDDCLGKSFDKTQIDYYIQILWQKYQDFVGGRY